MVGKYQNIAINPVRSMVVIWQHIKFNTLFFMLRLAKKILKYLTNFIHLRYKKTINLHAGKIKDVYDIFSVNKENDDVTHKHIMKY